ncbi:ubiquitin ligase (cullin) of SCF [Fusarium falciforme]|nr:ubiquitin ligase (cullin) of SCF [Fusarium falciforme]
MLNGEAGIDMQTYMGTYAAVQNFCTTQKAVGLSSPQLAGKHRRVHLRGQELYNKLNEYLTEHVEQLVTKSKDHTDEALLAFYIQEWDRYNVAAKYIHHLFRYLNRHWVKRELDEGRNVYDVYTLHLVKWRTVLFESASEKVIDAVLKLVEKQRNGENIDYRQIRQIVDSFVFLGFHEVDPSKTALDFYRFHFERPFLEATRLFYQAESKRLIAENSVVEYMKKAETRLDEEEERVRMYLHADTANPLMRTCNQALIVDHSDILRGEFQDLLDNGREQDMARLFNLLSRTPYGLDPLLSKFEPHLRKAGLAAVAKAASDAEKLEPKIYVGAVQTQYQGLVTGTLNDEPLFIRSSDNACRELGNRNDVCDSGSNKSPELRAKHTDGTGIEGSTYAISISEDWIARGGRNLVSLPPDYRATCAAFCNNMLVVGHRSGQVTFFKFSSS